MSSFNMPVAMDHMRTGDFYDYLLDCAADIRETEVEIDMNCCLAKIHDYARTVMDDAIWWSNASSNPEWAPSSGDIQEDIYKYASDVWKHNFRAAYKYAQTIKSKVNLADLDPAMWWGAICTASMQEAWNDVTLPPHAPAPTAENESVWHDDDLPF